MQILLQSQFLLPEMKSESVNSSIHKHDTLPITVDAINNI